MSQVVDTNGVVLDEFLEQFLPRLDNLMGTVASMNLDPVDLRLAHEVIATEMAAEFTDLMVGEFEDGGVDFGGIEDDEDEPEESSDPEPQADQEEPETAEEPEEGTQE